MRRFGLTKERYAQLLNLFDDVGEVEAQVKAWGADACNRGYTTFDFDQTGMLEINKIDVLGVFEDDAQAVEQAIKDGVKIIPVEELPDSFDRKYLGWIDTPENRRAIEGYCKRCSTAAIKDSDMF